MDSNPEVDLIIYFSERATASKRGELNRLLGAVNASKLGPKLVQPLHSGFSFNLWCQFEVMRKKLRKLNYKLEAGKDFYSRFISDVPLSSSMIKAKDTFFRLVDEREKLRLKELAEKVLLSLLSYD